MINEDGREMIKMSVFAQRSGVPVPTIKHYLREGLLPDPVRTSRNMAYYDPALIPRVRAIKRLQRTLFLPLRVIRQVLDRLGDGEVPADVAVEATIARVLGEVAPREALSRRQLLAGGVTDEELALFEAIGIITPDRIEGEAVYQGDDVSLLRVLGQARRAGLSVEMLPTEILADYVEAIRNLIRLELKLFRAGVVPVAGDDLPKLTEVATTLSERLVVLLRRKFLLPTLRRLADEERPDPRGPTDA
jgi:DNA-binding transcriptional MerR regulator